MYQPIRMRKKRMSEINVVPYIDVMLVLLVIFMVTAPLLTQGVDVELPSTEADVLEKSEQEPIIVSVDKNGAVYLNIGGEANKPLDTKTLVARVAAVLRHRKDDAVYIKGDTQANYGHVVAVMSMLQRAGVNNLGLVTKLPERQVSR